MPATAAVLALWLAFAGTHLGLSSARVRPHLRRTLGERGFQGVYSLVALALFVPLCWVYFTHRHAGPVLWEVSLGPVLRGAIYVGMGVGVGLLVAGVAQPSPFAIAPGKARVRGVHRLTRHPVFMGLGILGLLHLIPNGAASDVAFFAGFPIFAIVGAHHQDRRALRSGDPSLQAFLASTPFLPFCGRGSLRGLREISPLVIGGSVVLTVALRLLHGPLFLH